MLQPDANSAALGGAYRARHLTLTDRGSFSLLVSPVSQTAELVCSPNKDAVTVTPTVCLDTLLIVLLSGVWATHSEIQKTGKYRH